MSGERSRRRKLVIGLVVTLVVLFGLAAAWRWTPLHEYAEPRVVAHWLRVMAQSSWLPLLIAAVFVASNAVMFPNTVLCLATILALGGVQGFLYATGGSVLAAVVAYAAARRLGPEALKGLKFKSVDRLAKRLRNGGVVQVTLLRLLPLAPFNVVNVVAGIAHVRLMPFVLGTFFGLLPGNLLFTAFGRQIRRLVAAPTTEDLTLLGVGIVLTSALIWYVHRITAKATQS